MLRVVVEAKFQAELTDAQLNGTYLQRVPSTGLLVYLVPENRMLSLWRALIDAPATQSAIASSEPPQPLESVRLSAGRWIAFTSWEKVLAALDVRLKHHGDAATYGDLTQLRDLVQWRFGDDWIPLVPGDLPQRVGRQMSMLRQAIVKAITSLGYKITNGTSDTGFGRWILIPGGPQVWAGLWPGMLGRHGLTPLWLVIRPTSTMPVAVLTERLAPEWAKGTPQVKSESGWAFPIVPPNGAEHASVIVDLRRQLADVISLVLPVASQPITAGVDVPLGAPAEEDE